MRYLPHTTADIEAMLRAVGVESLDALFSSLPTDCRRKIDMNLPGPLTEWQLNQYMDTLSNSIAVSPEFKLFIGAGCYNHFIPATTGYLISRSEFSTAYTPYQPEISQGTLQTIYEYQTLVSRLLGMDVANASMYDGASALAEALLMAIRITRRKRVAISSLIHPHYRHVVKTYFSPTDYEVIELPYLPSGRTNLSSLDSLDELAAVAVQSPNFLGCIEDLGNVGGKTRSTTDNAILITCFTEPLAYGLLRNPGSFDADIVCGEGQSLGIPQCFGGPGLGIFATKKKYLRSMPGRLVGQTKDRDGKRGFVLTLSTREQHIRREKATSNICSNQGLCATAAIMYLAALGGTGIRKLAGLNYDKSEYLKRELKGSGHILPFGSPTFNEFVVRFPEGFAKTYRRLLSKKIVAGIPLQPHYPELSRHYLLCVTETSTKEDIDCLVKEICA